VGQLLSPGVLRQSMEDEGSLITESVSLERRKRLSFSMENLANISELQVLPNEQKDQ